jgi:DNA-binding transcriptional LysR family regulator
VALPDARPGLTDPELSRVACARVGFEPQSVFPVNDCERRQALVAAGVGVGFLSRLALHPVHPGVVVKPIAEAQAPRRRILALALPGSPQQRD